MSAVLDAWAVMALLRDEVAGDRVRAVVAEGDARMSSVNLGEVLYKLTRSGGSAFAQDRVHAVRRAVAVEDPDWGLVQSAAEIKAAGGLSYADAFCVATAKRHGAPLLTGDAEIVERAEGVKVVDLRSAGRERRR